MSVGERERGNTWPSPGMRLMCVCVFLWVCVGGGEGIDAHVLHLTQLTPRICLRGTSPPRPIHQPGPNMRCAAVDTGLTT